MRPGSDRWRLAGLDVEVVEADLREAASIPKGFGVVFHLAAHGAYSWQDDEARIRETNVVGTDHVLWAAGDARVVMAGSSSE